MRKQTKLFAILLTLAVVLGTVAIGASAAIGYDYSTAKNEAVTGETIITYYDFEGVTPGTKTGTGSMSKQTISANGKTVTLDYKGRNDLVSIVAATNGTTNQYMQINESAHSGKTNSSGSLVGDGAYMNISTGNGATSKISGANDLDSVGNSLADIKYHVIDFDVFFPEVASSRPAQRPDVHIEFRRYTSTKSADGTYSRDYIYNGGYGTNKDNYGIYFQHNDAKTAMESYHNYSGTVCKKNMSADQWTHYTYIVKSVLNDAGTPSDTTDDYIDLTFFTVMNGEIIYEYTPTLNLNQSKFLGGDMTKIFFSDLRIVFGDGSSNTYFDNLAIRAYDTSYDDSQLAGILAGGVGTDFTKWDRNAYDPANMPHGNKVATVGGVHYNSIDAAISNAEAGAVIELAKDDAASVTIDKPLTIKCNGCTVSGITVGDGYFKSVIAESDTIVIKPASEAYFKITSNEVDTYLDDNSLKNAVEKADAGTKVYVLKDLYITTTTDASIRASYLTINKAISIDLSGHTVYFSQSLNSGYANIAISTSDEVAIENGTFVVSINQNYIDKHAPTTNPIAQNSSAPLFRIFTNNAKVTFTDVNAYCGAFIYSYDKTGAEVTFNRGEYHIGRFVDVYGGGLVEARANITVKADGTVICLYNGTGLMTLVSRYESGERKSSAAFENCKILGTSKSHNVLQYLNNYTTIRFDSCDVFGSISPQKHANDTNGNNNSYPVGEAVNGAVVLGEGTRLATGATLKSDVVIPGDRMEIITASKSVTYALNLSTGSIFDMKNADFKVTKTDKSYSFGLAVDKSLYNNFTVTWYKEDGTTVILTQTVAEGTVGVLAPSYTPTGSNNGWYKIEFDGWTTVNGSSEKIDLSTFTVTSNVNFYPVTTNSFPTAYLSAAEYNLTLTGNITINFYLPEAPTGVTVIGVYDYYTGKAYEGKAMTVTGGQHRTVYVINTVGATELTTASKLRIVFTVTHNGEVFELTQNATVSPYKYAKLILEDSEKAKPVHSSATHTLIADMIRYSCTLSNTVLTTTNTQLTELLGKYEGLCSVLPTNQDFAEYTTNISTLKGYISTISFEVSEYQPRWVFTFAKSMKITDVQVTLSGYYPSPDKDGNNFGSITYALDTESSEYSGGYVTTAYIESIPMYNIDRVITITVTTESGKTVSGTYSLNSYFANVNATGETLENVRTFLKTFRAFGISSAGYRYSDGIKQASDARCDFFTCDHTTVGEWTETGGRYCYDCMTYVFIYADYINNLSSVYGGKLYTTRDEAFAGKVNSYSVIDYCHAKANAKYSAGNKVGVYAGNYAYYLSEALDYEGNINEITIMTDTCWSGAYFVVDDSPFNENDPTFKKSVFGIRASSTKAPDGKTYSNSGTNITDKIASALGVSSGRVLTPDTTNIGWSNGMPMLIALVDRSQSRYHREGVNASKAATQEVILIDEFGNVNSTTPIEWDYIYNPSFNSTSVAGGTTVYANSFYAVAYPITMAPIKISGLDKYGNINCRFETIANDNAIAIKYDACGRNITVRAANVTIEGLDHSMTEDSSTETPRQAYNGFINVLYAHNTVIKDMLVDQHVSSSYTNPSTGAKVGMGSYEFAGADSVYTSWINCVSKTFFDPDGSTTYRGLFGTNRMRNNYLKNCILNSYDAHSGAYNTTIEDSTFEHFNFIGQGDIIIKNTTIYVDGGYGGIILRSDYGSRWEGNIYIDGLDLRHSDEYNKHYVDLVKAEYRNWDFGYTDQTATSGNYLPFTIYAKNVTINEYTRSTQEYAIASPGQIAEELTKSDIPLGIYIYYDNGLKSKYNPDSDANQQMMTDAIYLEGGDVESLCNLCIPNNAYFKDMKIYINGVDQTTWYSKCSGKHTDNDNNHYCDICTARINCTSSHAGNKNSKCSACASTIAYKAS